LYTKFLWGIIKTIEKKGKVALNHGIY